MKSHFYVNFAVRNLKNSTYPLNRVNQTKASLMAVFTNDWVLAGLKIRHFQGLTVAGLWSAIFTRTPRNLEATPSVISLI